MRDVGVQRPMMVALGSRLSNSAIQAGRAGLCQRQVFDFAASVSAFRVSFVASLTRLPDL